MNISELSLSEQICYSTLRIEASIPPNSTSTGTGFLFTFNINNQLFIPCLVTNKHVVNGSTKTSLVLSYQQTDGALSHDTVEVASNLWINHSEVDLCVLPMQPIYNELIAQGRQPLVIPFDERLIPTQSQLQELSAIEEIIMVGYPDGIWDSYNNQPIIRRGITATHPHNDFNGKQEFLIDAACFPGSSGSPVMILNQGGYVDKRGNLNWGSSRIMLLGVLYAGPQHYAEGRIQFSALPKAFTNIPNNLGQVIKSSKLLDFKLSLKALLDDLK